MTGIESLIGFTVKRNEPELVAPAIPNPKTLKQLSDMDHNLSLRFHIPNIFFYKNNSSMDGQNPGMVIKQALAKALVYYYPLAGRLVEGSNKKLSVDCNGKGVLFIEASADITLDQLGDTILSPYRYLDEFLYNVPGSDNITGCPLICVQVTRLLCGGFILALKLNHTLCDGLGLGQFLHAVSEIARGALVPSVLPVWKRKLLNAQQPSYNKDKEKDVTLAMNMSDDLVQRSFVISPDFVKRIRNDLPQGLAKSTSYELLTACLWKCVALAWDMDPEETVYILVVLSARDKKYNANIPAGYYGNTIVCPPAISKSMWLCEKPLAYAVERVKAAKGILSGDYFRLMVESNAVLGRSQAQGTGLLAVSDVRFFGDIDFGWGFPVYAAPVIKSPKACHLSKYRNSKGNERIVAVLNLPRPVMHRFEEELNKLMVTTTMSKI